MTQNASFACEREALGSLMDRPMRIVVLIAPVALLLASPAFAQSSQVGSDELVQGLSCTSPEARSDLNTKVRAGANGAVEPGVMANRLNQISADAAVCQAVREAARDLATTYIQADPARQDEIVKASRAIVAQTLAEAERRAANLQFEIGPPPRHMTKGRNSGT